MLRSLLFFGALTLALTYTGTSNAQANQTNPMILARLQAESEAQITKALKIRQNRYYKRSQPQPSQNIKNQWQRHLMSRAQAGADGVSTFISRRGELKDVPKYSGRRPFTKKTVGYPNNSKRNFRTRAFDYYLDGGYADAQALKADVVLGSQHVSPIRFNNAAENKKMSVADIIAQIRADQKKHRQLDSNEVPAGYQNTTFRQGDWRRHLWHPFAE